jgi:hypothetical protein
MYHLVEKEPVAHELVVAYFTHVYSKIERMGGSLKISLMNCSIWIEIDLLGVISMGVWHYCAEHLPA